MNSNSIQKKIRIGIIGTGQRGQAFMKYFNEHPGCKVTALCDCDSSRMNEFAEKLGNLEGAARFTDGKSLISSGLIDACVICTPERWHAESAIFAAKKGLHFILEKPMAITVEECDAIIQAVRENGVIMQLGFVLRNTVLYKTVKQVCQSGELGQIMSIQADECLDVMHGASFMRRWHRKSANCGSFLLTKCSHDMDILNWIADSEPRSVASFGSLDFFKADSTRPVHCSQCTDMACPYRFNGEFVAMTKAEAADPCRFDLCVFNCDKDTVDNQTVIIEYANGIKASFNLNLFAGTGCRNIKIVGTKAYLEGNTITEKVKIIYSDKRPSRIIDCRAQNNSAHGGGDESFVQEFVDCIKTGRQPAANYAAGRLSTLVANAATQSRCQHRIVDIL